MHGSMESIVCLKESVKSLTSCHQAVEKCTLMVLVQNNFRKQAANDIGAKIVLPIWGTCEAPYTLMRDLKSPPGLTSNPSAILILRG